MLDRLEDVGRRAAHALGGAVGGDEVWKARVELAELAHEGVILGVGDLGPRLDVVQIVVVVNLLAQLGDALRGVGPRHARSITFSAGTSGGRAARRRCRRRPGRMVERSVLLPAVRGVDSGEREEVHQPEVAGAPTALRLYRRLRVA